MSGARGPAAEPREWEYVIVGAGSAGAVTAARLAARGSGSVLLLEAGADQPRPRDRSHPLADAGRLVLSGYNWDYRANLRTSSRLEDLVRGTGTPAGPGVGTPAGPGVGTPAGPGAGRAAARALWERFPYQLGKVVGGGSAVNGAIALRGLPRDFAAWAARGNPDWSWAQVLPFYKDIEHDADFPGPLHGDSGPLPVRRTPRARVHALDEAFWAECDRQGVTTLADLNAGAEAGVGAIPGNTVDGERVDAATAFLSGTRDLPDLHLRTGVRVTRVLFEKNRAVGVETESGGRLDTVRARHVVLSAGAVGTPVILQRSGVGGAALLRALGITPVADLPGVGRDLVDHPSVVIWSRPADGVCTPGLPWRQVAARMSSGYDGDTDIQMGLLNNVESHTIPGFVDRLGWPLVVGTSVMLLRPRSRGRVFLDSADPTAAPVIELGIGTDPEDVERLCHGVRRAWSFLRSPGLAGRLAQTQFWSDRMIASDGVVRSGVRHIMNPGWHAAGSCRMGPTTDPFAVAGQDGRVHGTEHLRIADASLFPAIPSAPTNLTTLMLAEKLARGTKE
ncbi:glucose-methanol-choline oxidoreductase [Streptomyces sp. SID8366]|uniref:GMC family oxidoreductase n=1 Tax=unclassified Streptomyces TaxID=2593676 RepID=UPI000DB97EAF|nr:GMC family oxidoreductase N-terminal domain-containing protein [Streptomyces sp. PsTaAH-130]MYU05133.1 glucose-methanol-choline oxidoreductase [Streptomyces sp. SID8366]MYU67249.1 glucose-methanol-choline oxidoreductase [Streptomyces sp. SID69]RAJ66010.1 choline dehydrogenase [Streptomyces sp. PsTaAH-130]